MKREDIGKVQIGKGGKMIKNPTKQIWLTLSFILVVTGCAHKSRRTTDELATAPDIDMLVVTDEYTPRAIAATGGYESWITLRKLEVDGLITFYKQDGSFYVTEQFHEIYPWSNSIRISADEPAGNFVWQLSSGSFTVLEGAKLIDNISEPMGEDFARAILYITTAPVRLLESAAVSSGTREPIRVETEWYYPIERLSRVSEPNTPTSKVIFYQNKATSLLDRILVGVGDKFVLVRGYDYRQFDRSGVLMPGKIEIFETDGEGKMRKRLLTVDY